MSTIRKILVPTDFSPHAEEAFRVAHDLARATGASVVVFHVSRPPAVVSDGGSTFTTPARDQEKDVWDRLSGLEVMRARLADEIPPAPIAQLTGLRLAAVSERGATFVLPASEWLSAAPPGRVQGGAIALLAEAALSTAIQTTLPARTALSPIDLKVSFLRPLASDGRDATARGTVMHAGRRLAVAQSEVHDADGRRIALATGSAMILPGRTASGASVDDATPDED